MLDCVVGAEKNIWVAKRAALLMSSRTPIFLCQLNTSDNINKLGDDIKWHDWTCTNVEHLYKHGPQRSPGPHEGHQGSKVNPKIYHSGIGMDALSDVMYIDRLIPSVLNKDSSMLAQRVTLWFEKLSWWCNFLHLIRPTTGDQFIRNIFDVQVIPPIENAWLKFIAECEKILYLEKDLNTIDKKIYCMIQKNKQMMSLHKYLCRKK